MENIKDVMGNITAQILNSNAFVSKIIFDFGDKIKWDRPLLRGFEKLDNLCCKECFREINIREDYYLWNENSNFDKTKYKKTLCLSCGSSFKNEYDLIYLLADRTCGFYKEIRVKANN
jgi:hypothetical protein